MHVCTGFAGDVPTAPQVKALDLPESVDGAMPDAASSQWLDHLFKIISGHNVNANSTAWQLIGAFLLHMLEEATQLGQLPLLWRTVKASEKWDDFRARYVHVIGL